MSKLVVHGAKLQCSCGTSQGTLTVAASLGTAGKDANIATVNDHHPSANIPSFGMCTTQGNPQVASATSANNGVLTPQPCTPMTAGGAWRPGAPLVVIKEVKALSDDSTLACQWSGTISIATPGSEVDLA
jgi:hypothetical protein